jgi:hypothetical protein
MVQLRQLGRQQWVSMVGKARQEELIYAFHFYVRNTL